jgi:hypothetical protein
VTNIHPHGVVALDIPCTHQVQLNRVGCMSGSMQGVGSVKSSAACTAFQAFCCLSRRFLYENRNVSVTKYFQSVKTTNGVPGGVEMCVSAQVPSVRYVHSHRSVASHATLGPDRDLGNSFIGVIGRPVMVSSKGSPDEG